MIYNVLVWCGGCKQLSEITYHSFLRCDEVSVCFIKLLYQRHDYPACNNASQCKKWFPWSYEVNLIAQVISVVVVGHATFPWNYLFSPFLRQNSRLIKLGLFKFQELMNQSKWRTFGSCLNPTKNQEKINRKTKLNLFLRLAVGFPLWQQIWRAGFCSVNHHILNRADYKSSACMFPSAFRFSQKKENRFGKGIYRFFYATFGSSGLRKEVLPQTIQIRRKKMMLITDVYYKQSRESLRRENKSTFSFVYTYFQKQCTATDTALFFTRIFKSKSVD